jgi:hypothetical protein
MDEDALVREIRELKGLLGRMLWCLGACTVLGQMTDLGTERGREIAAGALAHFSMMMELLEKEGGSGGEAQPPKWLQ